MEKTMNLHKTFYYCSECMHVYFDLPSSKECAICHNEMSEKNVITDLDILICETCNHIYTIQFPDELIPPYENNIHNLCGCKNKCPTTAFLAVGEQQSYYGNILKADIYRCQNCGAITFRNMGTQKIMLRMRIEIFRTITLGLFCKSYYLSMCKSKSWYSAEIAGFNRK